VLVIIALLINSPLGRPVTSCYIPDVEGNRITCKTFNPKNGFDLHIDLGIIKAPATHRWQMWVWGAIVFQGINHEREDGAFVFRSCTFFQKTAYATVVENIHRHKVVRGLVMDPKNSCQIWKKKSKTD
jgi:hypothetical protein